MLLQRRASFEQAQKTVGKEGAKRLLFSKKKRKNSGTLMWQSKVSDISL